MTDEQFRMIMEVLERIYTDAWRGSRGGERMYEEELLKELKRLNESNRRLEDELERITELLKTIDKHVYLFRD